MLHIKKHKYIAINKDNQKQSINRIKVLKEHVDIVLIVHKVLKIKMVKLIEQNKKGRWCNKSMF